MADLRAIAHDARAWPFAEARKIAQRYAGGTPAKGEVLFETGYGPSGLPHIGTFAEVARTTMVRHAFATLSDIPTRLVCFSDDMDGLRKVPDNIPNQEMVAEHLGKPLTSIPDPFGTHASFGHHNNARLEAFLDAFGFSYEFYSSTACYRSGLFDTTLLQVLANYERIVNLILPTLGPERRQTYSPFLPVCPRTGKVLQVPLTGRDPEAGTVTYDDPETGESVTVPVTGGHCKLQWKADWAMRWVALGVDYEMAGKDLIDSVKLSGKIAQALGWQAPEGFSYELFLDADGTKISKSKGNGLSVEDWLRYAPQESLAQYMFNSPRKAKKLAFDVIPKSVDEYLSHLGKYPQQDWTQRLENPVWHIHDGEPPAGRRQISYAVLLNLAAVVNAEDKSLLWGFITRYLPGASPDNDPFLDRLAGYAVAYYQDFVKPYKQYRDPEPAEAEALAELAGRLRGLPADADAETIQYEIYETGKRYEGFSSLRAWFKALYEILLGQSQGPRFGSFVALYGLDETIALIESRLEAARAAE